MLPPPLIALSPGDLAVGDELDFLRRLEAAVRGGLRGLLLREAVLDDGPLLALGRAARERLGPDAWLGLHDRAHLARAAGADALHLGFRSLALGSLPAALTEGLALGLSTHAPDDPAGWAGADYLFHGPVNATPSKQGLLEPVGIAGLRRAVASATAPVWGIGGLRPEDAAAVIGAGAAGVAALSGVLGAGHPERAARAWVEALAAAGCAR